MKYPCLLTAGLITFLLASSAFADIAPPRQFGQSLAPGEATKVAMTREMVIVTLLPKKALVRALFLLKNTGDAEKLVVGFPEATARGGSTVRLKGFSARVDGEVVQHVSQPRGADQESDAALKGWMTWDMTFAAGAERKVEVSYWVPYRPRYSPTLLGHRDFTYVLKTGAAWHGPIGKAVIDVRCGEGVTREHLGDIKLPEYTKTVQGVRWELTDIEPTEDVLLSVRRFKGYSEAGSFYLEQAKKHAAENAPRAAAQCEAAAAVCLWRTEDFERCLQCCRQVIAAEALPPKTRGPGRSGGRTRITPTYRAPPEVWERWVVRCLVKLDRKDEARAAAPAAIAALRFDLKERKRYRHQHIEDFEARIARYEAFAAGGDFED